MKTILGIFCLLHFGCLPGHAANVVIRDVTVVNVIDGSLMSGSTILVSGDRISAVGIADRMPVPDGAQILDASGGYLIPGLWDAHVHSAGSVEWHFPLYLAHGVTSVRNMHSTAEKPLELTNSIKRRLAAAELLGPRFLANGGVVDGDPPVWPGSVVVRNAADARRAVDRLADGGADFIKVYDFLTRDAYFAVLDQAKRRGIPVDGHVPFPVRPEEAAVAGQRTIEHTIGISSGCSSEAAAIRSDFARYVDERLEMPGYPDAMVAYFTLVRRSIDTRSAELCRATARVFREYGTVSVPTLVSNAGSDSHFFVNDPARMNLLPRSIREDWRTMADAGPDPIEVLLGPVDGIFVKNVRLLHEEGVTILAGTDVGNPFLVPGLSLHRELQRLTEAGITPLEALQTATINPARVFGLADTLGTIETGKLADLVLLDANPLDDIRNTQKIRAVVVNGRLLRRPDLDRLLAEVADMNLHDGEQE